MFVDHIRIKAQAGNGGNGIVHFRREKYVPRGGPDGGDGGDGGSITLVASNHVDNLQQYQYDPKLIAQNGDHGKGRKKHGKNGKSLIAKVPPGTLVYRSQATSISKAASMDRSGKSQPLELIADLTNSDESFLLCSGGKGGKGNFHYRSSTNQAPEEYTLGTEAESGIFYLELRRIADAGMVGFPNAGKSTLTAALSAARPKIASYPFTTLTPTVGVVKFPNNERCTIADIPGLIEGASQNRGLGHKFLRHIMRCRLLLFVLDMGGVDGRNPIDDLQILRTEIKEYSADLAKFNWIIIANKMDIEEAPKNLALLRQRFPKVPIVPLSASLGEGLQSLRDILQSQTAQS